MKRRDFLAKTGIVAVASLGTFPFPHNKSRLFSHPSSSNQEVKVKKMLFFDLWKLDYWDNCKLEQGTPEFVREATYIDNSAPGKGAAKPNVFFDQQNNVWRMVYNIGWGPVNLMTAISKDGINWQCDPQPKIKVEGERIASHHIYHLDNSAAGGIYYDPVAGDGYPFKLYVQISGDEVYQRAKNDKTHPLHRYTKQNSNPRTYHEGRIVVSENGLHWQMHPGYNWSRPDWHPEPPYFGFYNRKLNQHSMIVRPGWGDRRIAIQTTDSFKTWTEPELLLQMDPLEDAPVGFYTMPVISYGHMYVGLIWVFHNSSSKPLNSFNQFFGTMDAQLAYSYDGIRFIRGLREPILPLNPQPEHGCTQLRPYTIITENDEIRIYSGASRAPHGMEREKQQTGETINAIVMHRLREDGWMYLTSRGQWARIQTKPLGIFSPEIVLNAAASFGEVRFQVTDEKSQPLEGYTFKDCISLKNNDSQKWPLLWKNKSSVDLIGKVIRFEFEFYNANIYSVTAAYHMLDAQDQWLIKDGNTIEPARFDY